MPMIELGGFALIEGYHDEKNPTTDISRLVAAIQQGTKIYQHHYPHKQDLMIQMHQETAKRFGIDAELNGQRIYLDRDVPQGYVWISEAKHVSTGTL